jgi:uncharacterized protein (TIGR02466 family)
MDESPANQLEQLNLFATPIWKIDTNLDCEPIKTVVYKLKNKFETNHLTNVGGWQSPTFPRKDTPKSLDLLFTYLDSAVRTCLDSIAIPNKVHMHSFWLNINNKTNFNKIHNHRGALMSGVFYIQTPKNCGNISFERWDDSQYYLPEDLETRNIFTGSAINIEAEKGRLILFPSWLLHQVEPSQTEEDRISMSFNYILSGEKTAEELQTMGESK